MEPNGIEPQSFPGAQPASLPFPSADPTSPETLWAAKFPPDDDDLPDVPDEPEPPPSPPGGGGYGDDRDDDRDLRRIKSGTSWMGRISAFVFVVGACGLAFMYWRQSEADSHKWDLWDSAQTATSRDAFLAAITADLNKTSFEAVQLKYIEKIREYHYADAVPALIQALGDDDQTVRGDAALALATIGLPAAEPAKAKLLEVLPSMNVAQEAKVIWALAILGESRASDKIIQAFSDGRLQQQDGFDPKIISDVLGIARLAGLTGATNSVAVRTLAAMALSEAASAEAVDPLIRLLGDSEPEVVRAAAAGLGRTGDPRSGPPLFALLARQPMLKQSILDALRKSTGARGLVALVGGATDPVIKREITKMLRETHDPAAAEALVRLSSDADEETKLTAALGLADLGDARAVPFLLTLAGGTNEAAAQDSIDALRGLRSAEAGPALVPLLTQFLSRHAALLRAIGASGNAAACDALWAEVHPNGVPPDTIDDTEAALVSVGDLRCESAFQPLLDLLKRPEGIDYSVPTLENENSYRNRSKAAEALGLYENKPDAITALRTVVEDGTDDVRVRLAAAISLGRLADEATLREIVTKVKDGTTDAQVRQFYAQALWQKPSRALSADLLTLFGQAGGVPAQVSRAAALAVGYCGDPANDDRLMAMLDTEATRRDAAFAIALGGSPEAAAKLVTALATDGDLREVMQLAFQSQDSDDLELLTVDMFATGAVMRRIGAAQVLRVGVGDNRFGLAWIKILERLKAGWSGPGGATPRFAREKLYEGLVGSDADVRVVVADLLGDMNERGLLFRARDAGGVGATEARAKLREMNMGAAGSAPAAAH
jgi:HEAT repeat protein